MDFTREINRLMIGLLAAFALVAFSAAYWAIAGPETLLNREDNPRLVEAEAAIRRGSIYDRSGERLARSVPENGQMQREYLYDVTASALGYFSLRYGVGGAEAAYDPTLRGSDTSPTLSTHIEQDVLHRPQIGSDIRLSFDLNVQRQTVEAMDGQTGAVIIMTVPDGDILAMVSLPTYDPNTLDENWESLIDAEGNPFFNRPLQGQYQPGGTLQTPLMAAAILSDVALGEPIENATQPVQVGDVEITCLSQPMTDTLTLAEAYAYGCPYPFVRLAEQLGEPTVQAMFGAFRLQDPPTLTGFVVDPPNEVEATPEITPQPVEAGSTFQEAILGQGQVTINPLGMASSVAAIINAGRAPQPRVLLAQKPPETETWQPVETLRNATGIMTAETANHLRDLMIANTMYGAARPAGHPDLTIGGHSARAYSGEGAKVWFTGFVQLEDGRGAAVAVVLEDTDDTTIAADIGGQALRAAATSLQNDRSQP